LLGLGQFYTSTIFPRAKTEERPSFDDGAGAFEQGFALYECFETGGRHLLTPSHVEITHPERSGAKFAEDTFRQVLRAGHVEAGQAGASLSECSYRSVLQYTSSWG
jgi:hypothetical protein